MGVAYLEQPFPAGDLDAHARLRDEVVAPVVLDEPIDSRAAAIRAIEAGACDVVTVKPARLGITDARAVHDIALAAGLRTKVSGLVETHVGRAHARAVASLPGTAFSDIGDASWFLAGRVGEPGLCVAEVGSAPGIGFTPDPGVFAAYVVRESVLGSRIWD
jgi:O-succinylbenzoate synthase